MSTHSSGDERQGKHKAFSYKICERKKRVGPNEQRGERRPCGQKHCSFLIFLVLFASRQKERKANRKNVKLIILQMIDSKLLIKMPSSMAAILTLEN